MTILSMAIWIYNVILIKLQMAFFTEVEQKFVKFIQEKKKKDPRQPRQYWERKMKLEESILLTSDYVTEQQ